MKDKNLVQPQDLDEIVFENRNKEYGAYPLRKQYNNNVFTGLIVTLSIVVLLVLLAVLPRFL